MRFLTLPPFERAFEPHPLGRAFSNLTSFWVRLWALISSASFSPRFPSSPISFRTLIWAPISWIMRLRALSCCPFKTFLLFHLGRSPIIIKHLWKLYSSSIWVGCPLQWNHFEKSSHFSPPSKSSIRTHLGKSPIKTRPFWKIFVFFTTLKNLGIFHYFEKSLHFSPLWKVLMLFT